MADMPELTQNQRDAEQGQTQKFPRQLMDLLNENYDSLFWLPEGDAFAVSI